MTISDSLFVGIVGLICAGFAVIAVWAMGRARELNEEARQHLDDAEAALKRSLQARGVVAPTPGPWKQDQGTCMTFIRGPKQQYVAVLYHTDPDCAGNAPLVAAAPTLLHACKLVAQNAPAIRAWLAENEPMALRQVEAAIAEAEAR